MLHLPDGYFDDDTTPRARILAATNQSDDLAAARGCVYAILGGLGLWAVLFAWLIVAGFLIAGLR